MKNLSKVRELRQAKKLSKEEFAAKLGTSGAYIYQIETGNRNLSTKMARKIGEVFAVPWYSLYPQDDEHPENTE